jgi:hypothetical protein
VNFCNPHRLSFNPQKDIHDIGSILGYIKGLAVDDQKRIAVFLKKELEPEADPVRLESNLSIIITILAKEDWNRDESTSDAIPFDIDQKIEFNKLNRVREIIEEYAIHGIRISGIYDAFDQEGTNKSLSVLNGIKRLYTNHKARLSNDDLFDKVVECVMERVQESANFVPIPWEELELCANILVVDAFVRCKIFKNPVGYAHAAT